MVVFPSGKEYVIDTEEGKVYMREHIPVIIAKHFIRQARTDFLKRGIYTYLILITMSMRREIMHCF